MNGETGTKLVVEINQKTREDIARVKEHAQSHRVDIRRVFDTLRDAKLCVGNNPAHTVEGNCFRAVYSEEEQPSGLVRHLSLSILDHAPQGDNIGRAFCKFFLKEFGFEIEQETEVWPEDTGPNSSALNFAQLVSTADNL